MSIEPKLINNFVTIKYYEACVLDYDTIYKNIMSNEGQWSASGPRSKMHYQRASAWFGEFNIRFVAMGGPVDRTTLHRSNFYCGH